MSHYRLWSHQNLSHLIRIEILLLQIVSFGYDHAHTIYENLRLDIKQGQSIAIVGASGSGKTTLFNMLERLYDYNGSIHVGDVELKDISMDTWRNALGTITQDTYIFHASFGDNIRLPDRKQQLMS